MSSYFREQHQNNLPTVRIQKATLHNFKSVEYGEIVFDCGKRFVPYGTKADILGIYGQNGSGKTAFIEALSVLRIALNGDSIPGVYAECISKTSEFAKLEFVFELQYPDGKIRKAIYEFCICVIENESNDSKSDEKADNDMLKNKYSVRIFDEVLSMGGDIDGEKIKVQPIIDTRSKDIRVPFGPASKRKMLIGEDNESALMELAVNKRIAKEKSMSFIFMEETANVFRDSDLYSSFYQVFMELHFFSVYYFFVVDTKSSGIIRLNFGLPLYSRVGVMHLNANGPLTIDDETYEDLKTQFEAISVVVSQLVPGLKVYVQSISPTILKSGESGQIIELIAERNGIKMPLKYESDGVRKIISILSLIISAYNQQSTTVAIDEFDAGIFEYLLGEILETFEESGKGQFIFTSHNLRPLEVIDKKYLYFTTTNPKNRYIHLKNIGKSNNLRNTYFRELVLGDQDEELYKNTQHHKIGAAFRRAGRIDGEA